MSGFYTPGSRGTVTGVPEDEFDPEAACRAIQEAIAGCGTQESVIIDIIAAHNYEQRKILQSKYKTMFGKNLNEDLDDELGGVFSKAISGLLMDPEEFLVTQVHEAIAGIGTDEKRLVSLLCFRSNAELEEMKKYYKEKYGKEMEEDVAEDLSGDLRTLMISIINAGRDESDEVDPDKVKADAETLIEASSGAGTSEEVFNSIFNCRSPAHMRAVFDTFEDLTEGKTIEDTIESEFSGSIQNAYLAMIKSFRNLVAYNAERLHKAMKGIGTDDDILTEIIISRSEIDLKDIAEFYEVKYEKSLRDAVASETSGDYRSILVQILGNEVDE